MKDTDLPSIKDVERSDSVSSDALPKTEPSNRVTRWLEPYFNVHTRGSTWGGEIR